MPNHHPSAALLTDYASGALRPVFAVVVSAHLEACPHCRATVAGLEALGGEMIAALPKSHLSDEAMGRVMAGIERPLSPAEPGPLPIDQRLPFGRERWLGPGMSMRKADFDGQGLLYRLRLPPGQATFPHGHHGVEYTVVLKGAFNDGLETYAAGDFGEAHPGLEHLPHVTRDGECVCLIASEKPLRAMSWVGRYFQTLARV
ncbi:MAG: hypothetical protein EON94_01060 [Caulobacteraceae bacterium]|nr:MAG: hypothetical protein EON94_01060 [Caulobacteraceae bacterium]